MAKPRREWVRRCALVAVSVTVAILVCWVTRPADEPQSSTTRPRRLPATDLTGVPRFSPSDGAQPTSSSARPPVAATLRVEARPQRPGHPPFLPLGGFDDVPTLDLARTVAPVATADLFPQAAALCARLAAEGTDFVDAGRQLDDASPDALEACFRASAQAAAATTPLAEAAWVYAVLVDSATRTADDLARADAKVTSWLPQPTPVQAEVAARWLATMGDLISVDDARLDAVRHTDAWSWEYELIVLLASAQVAILQDDDRVLDLLEDLASDSRCEMEALTHHQWVACSSLEDFISYAVTILEPGSDHPHLVEAAEGCLVACVQPLQIQCQRDDTLLWSASVSAWRTSGPACGQTLVADCMYTCGPYSPDIGRIELIWYGVPTDWNTTSLTLDPP